MSFKAIDEKRITNDLTVAFNRSLQFLFMRETGKKWKSIKNDDANCHYISGLPMDTGTGSGLTFSRDAENAITAPNVPFASKVYKDPIFKTDLGLTKKCTSIEDIATYIHNDKDYYYSIILIATSDPAEYNNNNTIVFATSRKGAFYGTSNTVRIFWPWANGNLAGIYTVTGSNAITDQITTLVKSYSGTIKSPYQISVAKVESY